jgi:predicted GNAT family acetyltransferase
MSFHDNKAALRFEWREDGHVAFADYARQGNVLVIPHVEAPPALRGTGAAGRLMQAVVDHARENDVKLRPMCSYAAAWLMRHKEHADLIV